MADNSLDNPELMADNSLNNPELIPDNSLNNPELTADNEQQEKKIFEKIAISQLMQKYNLARTQFYDRMKYLQITTWKVSGKAYLDNEQVAQMDSLHEHIKEHGRIDGYPVPVPSGPLGIVETAETETQGAIVVQEEQKSLQESEPNYGDRKAYSNSPQDDMAFVARRGAERVAAMLAGEDAVVNYLLENPEQLPADLRATVEASRAKLNQTAQRRQEQYDPDFFAQMAIASLLR